MHSCKRRINKFVICLCRLHIYIVEDSICDQIKEDETDGSRGEMGEMRNVHKFLIEEPEGKSTLGRPRCRWEANINGS
jgi:hypothetical protein